jgi:cell division protease FtsH
VYATITTGAESDIQQLTAIARQMVGRWGMSDAIGLVAVLSADGLGPLLPGATEASQATQQLLDDEVRALIDTAHRDVTDLLTTYRQQLDNLAIALLNLETLDGIDAYHAAGLPTHPNPRPDAHLSAMPPTARPGSMDAASYTSLVTKRARKGTPRRTE